jgi:hypothetical protein
MRSIYLQSFMLTSLEFLELCPGQSFKYKNKQRAITPKLGKAELWFLWTAPNEIYLPTKFHVDTSCCFKVPTRIADGDERTDPNFFPLKMFLLSYSNNMPSLKKF